MTMMERIKAQTMRIWSWTVDDWNTAFQVLTTMFVAGTVLTGLGAMFTDRAVRKRQAEELAITKANTVKLQTDLAAQQERAAKAEKELLEVQERFKPRTMSQSEQNNLVGLLRAYASLAREAKEKNRETLWIVHPTGDTEATVFASMLTGLFIQAGWEPNLRDLALSEHTVGLEILVQDANNLPLLAQALKRVLEEARIPFAVKSEPNTDARTWLIVGSKQ
jgi:hypothetical protein